MKERLTPPDWDSLDPMMLLNVSDAKLYYENFTSVVDAQAETNKLGIETLDGRVTALEQSTPVGPGGKGAYLNLGGTPERYPTAEEMVAGDTPESTSFLVVARQDGIYFYNPKSKLLIPPKKGGGTVAIHASFPDIFDDGHTIKHDTRIGKSGVYTAKCADVGLDGTFLSYDTAKILVVTTADMEYQTALHPDGTASRTFTPGNNVTPWSFHTGSGGGGTGGGSIDPVVIQEINRRLAALEAKPDPVGTFEGLSDVAVDVVTDIDGLLYLGEDGKVRGGAINPMLAMGYTPIQAASVGFTSTAVTGNVAAITIAASPVVLMTSEANRTATLPNIVPFNTVKPSTTQIREGRLTYFVNSANMQKTLRVTSGQRFYKDGNMDSANVILPGKTTYIYNAAILDNGSGAMLECFVYMGQVQHQDADMSSILDGFTNLSNMHDAQQVEIDFLRSEQEKGKLTVEGLQAAHTDTVDRLVATETNVADMGVSITEAFTQQNGLIDNIQTAVNSSNGRISSLENSAKNPAAKNDFHKVSLESTNNFQAAMSAEADVIVHNLSVNSNPRVWLPEIVATSATPTASQVLVGRKMVIVNTGAQATKVGGAMMHFSDTISTNTYDLPVGHSMEMYAHFYSSTFGWRVVRSGPVLPATGGGSGGSSTFVGLTDTPNTLTPNKIVTVNAAGNALVMSTASTTDLAGALKLAQGVVSGNSLLSSNCVGGEVGQSGMEFISQADLTGSPLLLVAAWRTMTWVNLPTVIKFDTDPLPANTVREGRLTTVYNCSSARDSKPFKLRIDPSHTNTRLLAPNYDVITEYEVPYGYGVRIMPVFDHTGTEANKRQWMVLEKFKREQS